LGYTCKEHNFFTLSQEKFHDHMMNEHIDKLPKSKPSKSTSVFDDMRPIKNRILR